MSELLLLCGKPGSGKSTAAAKVAGLLEDRHLSIGNRLRAVSRGEESSRYNAELHLMQKLLRRMNLFPPRWLQAYLKNSLKAPPGLS